MGFQLIEDLKTKSPESAAQNYPQLLSRVREIAVPMEVLAKHNLSLSGVMAHGELPPNAVPLFQLAIVDPCVRLLVGSHSWARVEPGEKPPFFHLSWTETRDGVLDVVKMGFVEKGNGAREGDGMARVMAAGAVHARVDPPAPPREFQVGRLLRHDDWVHLFSKDRHQTRIGVSGRILRSLLSEDLCDYIDNHGWVGITVLFDEDDHPVGLRVPKP